MNITINPDLSSHIVNDDNTLECFLTNNNPETQIPFGSEDEVREFITTSVFSNPNYFQPYKSAEQRAEEKLAALVTGNVARAKMELVATDWCENLSVRDSSLTPHLMNASEFDAYRLALRSIIVNKSAEIASWPEQPQAQWSTT